MIALKTWKVVNRKHGTQFSNVLSLIDVILSLPAHLAVCEKGFSLINAVKAYWRSKLGGHVLTNQLRII